MLPRHSWHAGGRPPRIYPINQTSDRVVAHDLADADPARLGQCFEPSRQIDVVAVDVLVVGDDLAEIDADTERDAALMGDIANGHRALPFDRAAHRVNDAGKFDQQSVAGGLDNATTVLG